MTTLSVFKFETTEGADQALASLVEMQKQKLIVLQDAATVVWEQGKKKPKTRQAYNLTAAGAVSGAFWGMLFGLLFFVPFFGLAFGAAMGAMSGKMGDYGIDDTFIANVKSKVTEGTSAIFLLTSNEVASKVIDEMKKWPKFEIVSTNLTAEQDATLRAEFGEE